MWGGDETTDGEEKGGPVAELDLVIHRRGGRVGRWKKSGYIE